MEDYELQLFRFRSLIEKYTKEDSSRREKEYGNYLKRWFSEVPTDGAPFSIKYRWKQLPMSYLVYTMG